jgi:energy-converting hydrogenase Eha subunit A
MAVVANIKTVSVFIVFPYVLAAIATVIIAVAITIPLATISRPVRLTVTAIIAITAVITVSIAIIMSHQAAQSAAN